MATAIRRVYVPELKQRTGWGETWIRMKETRGEIPRGRRDPGGKRKWWTSAEADAIVLGEPVSSHEQVG